MADSSSTGERTMVEPREIVRAEPEDTTLSHRVCVPCQGGDPKVGICGSPTRNGPIRYNIPIPPDACVVCLEIWVCPTCGRT